MVASQRNAEVRRKKPRAQARQSAPPPADTTEVSASRSADAEVPAGTILRVSFSQPISTATAKVGETVSGELLDDLIAEDGTIVARSGSKVTGKVEHVWTGGWRRRSCGPADRPRDAVGNPPIATPLSAHEAPHNKRNVGYIAGGAPSAR